MASELFRCTGCEDKILELDFGTGTPWHIMGKDGVFHDKSRGVMQERDDDDMEDPRLCGPMYPASATEVYAHRVEHDPGFGEHARLAFAAEALIRAIHPDFIGYLPTALLAIEDEVCIDEYNTQIVEDMKSTLEDWSR